MTRWGIEDIRDALLRNDSASSGIPISLISEIDVVGVGSTTRSISVLVPPDPGANEIHGKRLVYLPKTTVFVPELDREISAGIVSISKSDLDSEELEMLAIITLSLVQIAWGARGQVSLGASIAAVARFLEAHFVKSVDLDVITGLIGELLLIAKSESPDSLVAGWHENVSDSYDFRWGSQLLEVKSSTKPGRQHYFSSTQIPPTQGFELQIASVLVQRSHSGITLGDLIDAVARRVTTTSLQKIRRISLETIGMPSEFAGEYRFTVEGNDQLIRFYDWRNIPSPTGGVKILRMNWLTDLDHVKESAPIPSLHIGASQNEI